MTFQFNCYKLKLATYQIIKSANVNLWISFAHCKHIYIFFRAMGTFWKMARIGERKSPWVAAACVLMAVNILFLS